MPLPANWTDGGTAFHASDENAVEVAVNALSAFSTKSANYTLTATDSYLAVDVSGGALTMTLLSAVGIAGKRFTLEKVDPSVNTVSIATTSSQTINGRSSDMLVFPNHRISVVSDGANWLIELNNYAGTLLGYAELDWPFTFTNTVPASAGSYKASGLSITTIGAGRSVAVKFSGQGYGQTANTFVVAQLLINNSLTGGKNAIGFSTANGIYDPLVFEHSVVLQMGVSYTFEIGMWNQSGTGVLYADLSTPTPVTFKVAGE